MITIVGKLVSVRSFQTHFEVTNHQRSSITIYERKTHYFLMTVKDSDSPKNVYNLELLKPYLKLKTNSENKELYSLCNASTVNEKASIRNLKSRYLKEFENNKNNESESGPMSVRKKRLSKYHIFPLLKTFKLLPLYIMGKSKLYAENYDYAKNCVNNANSETSETKSFTETICLIIDQINNGEYSLDDITDFTYNSYIRLEQIGFSHNIWAKNCIINSNSWLKLDRIIEMDKMKLITTKQKQEEYLKIKGKILIEYLPKFLAIFFYSRNKEDIVKDLAKSCYYNNLSTNTPISLTQILEQYNNELGFLKRPDEHYIHLNYNEKEFLR